MHYAIESNLRPLAGPEEEGQQLHIIADSGEGLDQFSLPEGLEAEELKASQHSRFCKAESHSGYLLGTLCIPAKGKGKKTHCLVYAVWEDHLLLLDQEGFAETCCEKISKKSPWKNPGLGQTLHDFLSLLIFDDLRHLENLEGSITALENQVMEGKLENFNRQLLHYRREIMALAHYYSQMADMTEELLQNENHFFNSEELRLFELLENRLLRLKEEAYILREYALQIREVYQSALDLRQNSIMQTLTIVTTIFLPLSLIAGWYGMNFSNMPELSWEYGYPVIVIISVAVVAFCIWLFKKKKFW
ncbi:MAG: CorA family divalent cation transporter [Blautia sp.]|jgi:magnesium transporter